KTAGEGQPLLILHGWGGSADSWKGIQDRVATEGYQVTSVDLPGFGETQAPTKVWGIEDYAEFVAAFVKKLEIEKIFILGHSFGGQIAIQFAVKHPDRVEGLVLCAAAGVRRKKSLKVCIVQMIAKIGKTVASVLPVQEDRLRSLFYKIIRRGDYVKSRGIMKRIFQKVIRQDLSFSFSYIRMPTLIVWGGQDQITPVEDGERMKDSMSETEFKVIQSSGHNIHFDAPDELVSVLLRFLKQ
ncbi:MAG: alpha/beta hydrolase, partial [archaeon]|nr:alpha/beta hydrolase [archaeon]